MARPRAIRKIVKKEFIKFQVTIVAICGC